MTFFNILIDFREYLSLNSKTFILNNKNLLPYMADQTKKVRKINTKKKFVADGVF